MSNKKKKDANGTWSITKLMTFMDMGKRCKTNKDIRTRFGCSSIGAVQRVHNARRHGRAIWTGKNGKFFYTTRPKPQDCIFDTKMKLKFSLGVLKNSAPAMSKSLQIVGTEVQKICFEEGSKILGELNFASNKPVLIENKESV